MFDALWGPIATVVAAAIGAVALVVTQRQKRLIEDCRLAIRDLKRFRDLEVLWSEELSNLLKSTPIAERKRMRGMLPVGNKIGDYGEPQRIEKLLARLG
jgi:hypothetical protein